MDSVPYILAQSKYNKVPMSEAVGQIKCISYIQILQHMRVVSQEQTYHRD